MAAEVEPSHQYPIVAVWQMAAEGGLTQWCLTRKCMWREGMSEKIAPINVCWCLVNVLWRPKSGCEHSEAVGGVSAATAVTSTGARFYKHNTQGLIHWWWMCINSTGSDCVEKIVFCSWEFALSSSVVVHVVSAVVSMEINRRHYFQSNIHIFKNHCRVLPAWLFR